MAIKTTNEDRCNTEASEEMEGLIYKIATISLQAIQRIEKMQVQINARAITKYCQDGSQLKYIPLILYPGDFLYKQREMVIYPDDFCISAK